MLSFWARRARPCDVSAPETAGAADTASTASGRSRAEDLGGARICSAAAARRLACPAGEILGPQRLTAAPAGSSDRRDMQGQACRSPGETSTRPIRSKDFAGRPAAPNLAKPSKLCTAASFGRHATATTLVPDRCRSGCLVEAGTRADTQISETVESLSRVAERWFGDHHRAELHGTPPQRDSLRAVAPRRTHTVIP
jgi:hypothetical protein